MRIKIRQAEQEDYNPLCRFIQLVDNEFYPPLSARGNGLEQRVRECLAGRHSYYMLAEDNTDTEETTDKILGVIGCNKYWKGKKDAYINLMCVHPQLRRKGISAVLCKELEKRVIVEGIGKLYVCTWSTNIPAMRFYEANGFVPYCVVKNDRGHRVDTIHYRKVFDAQI
ncbi:GNAT family N-acetyltransferase [Methanomethylovorans sp.]|uniref:GNAT family N-acetyltransferase n=1 Tax=Methanomethylovorans sp. TaxID=2758717 RepID=UPI00351CA782